MRYSMKHCRAPAEIDLSSIQLHILYCHLRGFLQRLPVLESFFSVLTSVNLPRGSGTVQEEPRLAGVGEAYVKQIPPVQRVLLLRGHMQRLAKHRGGISRVVLPPLRGRGQQKPQQKVTVIKMGVGTQKQLLALFSQVVEIRHELRAVINIFPRITKNVRVIRPTQRGKVGPIKRALVVLRGDVANRGVVPQHGVILCGIHEIHTQDDTVERAEAEGFTKHQKIFPFLAALEKPKPTPGGVCGVQRGNLLRGSSRASVEGHEDLALLAKRQQVPGVEIKHNPASAIAHIEGELLDGLALKAGPGGGVALGEFLEQEGTKPAIDHREKGLETVAYQGVVEVKPHPLLRGG
mmetsp:Transcript_14983/g.20943  ORF Transcript_14983/g.20943 Transcript_14983/m.20943 type:complete len:349 (-) Transcript_14983:85-1131(-)